MKTFSKHRLSSTTADGVSYWIEAYENPQRQQSLQQFIVEAPAAYDFNLSTGRDLTISSFPGGEYLYKAEGLPGTEQFFETEELEYHFNL